MTVIPSWRENQIRRSSEPLNHLTYAHAGELLKRVHRRVDSLRFQLWSTLREVEELQVRLGMGNPQQAPIHKTKRSPWKMASKFLRRDDLAPSPRDAEPPIQLDAFRN